ncbi:hypothetical protein M758_12G108400 [Ceratodon purpureus]|nr:hypothetical protein M758_12G108400 [Ceratodon purpureus]
MRHGNVYLLNAKCNPGRHRAETHHSLADHADKADIRTFMSRQRACVSGAQGHPGACICFLVVNSHVCKLANRFFQQSTPELAQVQGLSISHATNGYSRHSCKWAWIGPHSWSKHTNVCSELLETPPSTKPNQACWHCRARHPASASHANSRISQRLQNVGRLITPTITRFKNHSKTRPPTQLATTTKQMNRHRFQHEALVGKLFMEQHSSLRQFLLNDEHQTPRQLTMKDPTQYSLQRESLTSMRKHQKPCTSPKTLNNKPFTETHHMRSHAHPQAYANVRVTQHRMKIDT